MDNLVITKFRSLFKAQDPAGRRVEFASRKYACFIITVKGKIRFSYNGGHLISEDSSPVFLPMGLTYVNECLESAESYVFNFETESTDHTPSGLSAISHTAVEEYYVKIRAILTDTDHSGRLLIFEAMYSLAHKLISPSAGLRASHPIVAKAIGYITKKYESPDLSVGELAEHCAVSEVYLRKLFCAELGISPHAKITAMRMDKAKMLLEEKRPLKEIADSVGYSDVFGFSRAYKRHFGHSPKKQ